MRTARVLILAIGILGSPAAAPAAFRFTCPIPSTVVDHGPALGAPIGSGAKGCEARAQVATDVECTVSVNVSSSVSDLAQKVTDCASIVRNSYSCRSLKADFDDLARRHNNNVPCALMRPARR